MKILVKFILDLFDTITEIKTTKFLKKILLNDINVLIDVGSHKGEFLENAECHGAKYGTAKTPVDSNLKSGKDIILEIDYQGALIVKKIFKEAISIFIIPPSIQILKQRLEARGQNSSDEINGRLAAAKEEISHLEKFDYVIINEDFDKALDDFKSIYDDSNESKKLKTARQKEIFQNLINSIKK